MAQLDSTICIQVNEISNLTLTFYWYMYCFSGFQDTETPRRRTSCCFGHHNPIVTTMKVTIATAPRVTITNRCVRCLDRGVVTVHIVVLYILSPTTICTKRQYVPSQGCWAVKTSHIHFLHFFLFFPFVALSETIQKKIYSLETTVKHFF